MSVPSVATTLTYCTALLKLPPGAVNCADVSVRVSPEPPSVTVPSDVRVESYAVATQVAVPASV